MKLENFTKKLMAGSALVAASAALPQKSDAQVEPYMDVDTTVNVGDFDSSFPAHLQNPGDEQKSKYTITNFGDGDNSNNPDGSAYNLIEFVVPAGSNQGVFNYVTPGGSWTGNIGTDATTFTGNGSSIGPGNTGSFELWADDATPTGIVQSTALATGNTSNQPFRDYDNGNLSSNQYVPVTAPIPEPGQGALLVALGAGAAALGQRRHSPKAEEEKPIRFF